MSDEAYLFLFYFVILAGASLGGYKYWQSDISLAASHAVELKCHGFLDGNRNCDKIISVGAELELIANPHTNVVHVKILNDPGEYGVKSFFFSDCKVADSNNWQCGTSNNMYAMEDGKYFSLYEPVETPGFAYDYSSLSGIDYFKYKIGLITISLER